MMDNHWRRCPRPARGRGFLKHSKVDFSRRFYGAAETILSLSNFFKQRNDTGAVQQAETRFMEMRKDPDPYLREKWTDCKNQYQASKQVRRSLPAMLPTLLPASAEPTDLKKRKVVPKPAATPMKAKSRTSFFIPRAPGRSERTLSMRLSGTKCMRL